MFRPLFDLKTSSGGGTTPTGLVHAMTMRTGFYIPPTHRWYLERRIYLAVGVNISVASILSMAHNPWWLSFIGLVGVAMVWFGATGSCIMANGLSWLGAEPCIRTDGNRHRGSRRCHRRPERSPTPMARQRTPTILRYFPLESR